jgi:DNA-binding NarL/FixJ family response regulator
MNEQRALQAGAAAFFQKPADNEELLSAIRLTLSLGQGQQPAWPS